jgi:hypothetical protein
MNAQAPLLSRIIKIIFPIELSEGNEMGSTKDLLRMNSGFAPIFAPRFCFELQVRSGEAYAPMAHLESADHGDELTEVLLGSKILATMIFADD